MICPPPPGQHSHWPQPNREPTPQAKLKKKAPLPKRNGAPSRSRSSPLQAVPWNQPTACCCHRLLHCPQFNLYTLQRLTFFETPGEQGAEPPPKSCGQRAAPSRLLTPSHARQNHHTTDHDIGRTIFRKPQSDTVSPRGRRRWRGGGSTTKCGRTPRGEQRNAVAPLFPQAPLASDQGENDSCHDAGTGREFQTERHPGRRS